MKLEINRDEALIISRALLELRDRLLENAAMIDENSIMHEDCILQAVRCRAIEFMINDQLNKE